VTKHVDTAFERHFSEPPVVAVKEGRTHCEACKEPLDPSVMHKCHGNQEYQAPVVSATEITQRCPECSTGEGVLLSLPFYGVVEHVVVCKTCRRYLYPLVNDPGKAISSWNEQAMRGLKGCWPVWRAALPGDDERANVIQGDAKPAQPDLANYTGECPKCRGGRDLVFNAESVGCDLCGGKGVIA